MICPAVPLFHLPIRAWWFYARRLPRQKVNSLVSGSFRCRTCGEIAGYGGAEGGWERRPQDTAAYHRDKTQAAKPGRENTLPCNVLSSPARATGRGTSAVSDRLPLAKGSGARSGGFGGQPKRRDRSYGKAGSAPQIFRQTAPPRRAKFPSEERRDLPMPLKNIPTKWRAQRQRGEPKPGGAKRPPAQVGA